MSGWRIAFASFELPSLAALAADVVRLCSPTPANHIGRFGNAPAFTEHAETRPTTFSGWTLANQQGVSVLAIVLVILALTAIGYTFTAMMAAKQKSIPVTVEAARAFYIAEGGIEFAGKHLSTLSSGQWGGPPANESRNLAGGSFTVTFSNHSSIGGVESIDATCTGTYGAAQRVLIANFSRQL